MHLKGFLCTKRAFLAFEGLLSGHFSHLGEITMQMVDSITFRAHRIITEKTLHMSARNAKSKGKIGQLDKPKAMTYLTS